MNSWPQTWSSWHALPTMEVATDVVMVIDDDPAFLDALTDAIRSEGYRVATAGNGVEALNALRWGLRPRVILLDMQMQTMNGWEFRAEQKQTPALAAIPVVAMTAGYWKERDLADFKARLQKPIDLGLLRTVLRGGDRDRC